MPYRPTDPFIKTAMETARKMGAPQIIIISIGGDVRMTSFGETKSLCDKAAIWGDAAFEAVMKKITEDRA